MLFVPVVPPHAQPPSPRTRELADLLTRAIEEYEKYHPNVSGAEVRAALQMAAARSSRGVPSRVLVLAGVVGALALGGVFVMLASNQGQMPGDSAPMVVAALIVVGLGLLVAVVKSRSG